MSSEHYKATIEYDGTDFYGFQRQPGVRTVQSALESVLSTLQGGVSVTVRGAGRTDSGVHATGQVVDFHLRWNKDAAALQRSMNALLPEDVVVQALSRAPTDFHARYDALSRTYQYTLYNDPQRQPMLRRFTLHVPLPLEEEAMNEAVQHLQGEHDFAAFGRATTATENTVRTMIACRVWREGRLVKVQLEANGFLFRMVRSIVGCLLLVGRGEQSPAWLGELLATGNRQLAATVIPPTGLCLMDVHYP